MMRKKLHILELIGRYIISISALSTALFFRAGIGSNIYAPFTTAPFGKGKGFYRADIGIRIWMILLLYLWMRLFAVLCFIGDAHFFHINDWASWGHIFKSFYTWSFFWDNLYPTSAIVFMGLSYAVVIVAALQLLVAYELLPKHKRPEKTYLGFSLLFGWFTKSKKEQDHYQIWQFVEPSLMTLIGGCLYYFSFPIQASFFILSAIALAIQGQSKRLKKRNEEEIHEQALIDRKITVELQKKLEKERGVLKGKKPDEKDDDLDTAPW